jgi:hypothetical protein
MNSFEIIAGANGPAIIELPICGNLDPVRFSIDKVLVGGRQNEMRRGRRFLEERRGRLGGLQVAVVI